MLTLVAGLLLFLGVHSVSIVAPQWRDRIVVHMGRGAWMGLYSLIAVAGFVLILRGYGLARAMPVVWYVPPAWLHSVARLLMAPVFPLLLATYLPGQIRTAVKHPMLAAVKFWALAHLLANGMAADVLLFGGFLLWAVVDRVSLKRRPPRPVQGLPATRWNDAIVVIGGLALYVVFMGYLHQRLFGVSPLA